MRLLTRVYGIYLTGQWIFIQTAGETDLTEYMTEFISTAAGTCTRLS